MDYLFQVCLQFPDHLLPHSSEVALKLQKILGQTVYILGDTAYERYVILNCREKLLIDN